jgi:hypothetical protein
MVDPFESTEVPILVTRGGALVAFSPFDEFVSVTVTGVEKVEDGGSVMGLLESVTAAEAARVADVECF